MKQNFIFLIFLICVYFTYAQKEANNWYFANHAGITFNTHDGSSIADTNGSISSNDEVGVAAISDKDGNLLFYTDGFRVWNRKHVLMPNGMGLKGGPEFFQGVIIVPIPDDNKRYYIFYTRWSAQGFYYSIVDMNQDKGLGDIIEKNTIIDESKYFESVVATRHANKKDFWIVTHELFSDVIRCYLINNTGFINNPIIYHSGIKHDVVLKWVSEIMNGNYSTKFSPDGKKLALVEDTIDVDNNYNIHCELYDFDNSNGLISNIQYIKLPEYTLDSIYQSCFNGIEFSPNSKRLYMSSQDGIIIQYNIDLLILDSIVNSYKFIVLNRADSSWSGLSSLQLGPDGKIYQLPCAYVKYLNVINNPDEIYPACSYIHDAVYLGGRNGFALLPTFILNFNLAINYNNPICEGDTLFLNANYYKKAVYSWLGPNGFISDKQTTFIPNVGYLNSGWYYVQAITSTDTLRDSVLITVYSLPRAKILSSGKTEFCKGDSVMLTASPIDKKFKYQWSTGDSTTKISAIRNGIYILTIENENGCKDRDTINIIVDSIPDLKIEASGPTSFCLGDSVSLTAHPTGNEFKYHWNTGDVTQSIMVRDSGIYKVIVENEKGCKDSISIVVKVASNLQISIAGNNEFCQGDSVLLSVIPNDKKLMYKWSNKETAPNIWVKDSGKYWVSVENQNGCKGSDTIDVIIHPKPIAKIEASGPTEFCEGNSVIITVQSDNLKYKWSRGDTTKQILVDSAGTYSVLVENEYGCKDSATINVTVYPNPEVKIFGNTSFCDGDSTKLGCDGDFVSYKWSNNETTKEIWVKEEGKYSVTVIDSNGCSASAEIEVSKIVISCQLSVAGDVELGRIKIDSTADSIITLKNTGNEILTISARLLNGDGFSLETQPQSPANIDTDSIFTIKVIFSPKEEKEYTDSLIIEISSPCYKRIAIYLHGSGYKEFVAPIPVTVWFPDTVGKVGDKNFRIPLYSVTRNSIPVNNIPYTATIRYNATLFLADSITKGTLIKNDLISREQTLEIECDNLTLSQDTTIITQLIGTVLLGNTIKTPLRIDSIDIKYPNIEIIKKHGSLRIEGLCQQIYSRIKTITPPDIQIFPNPSGSTITITAKLGNTSDLNISIFNSIGDKKMEFNEKAGAGQFKKEINLESLPAGKYFVNISINSDTWCWGVIKE